MKMKRLLALLLAVCMVFTLCACSKEEAKEPDTDNENNTNVGDELGTELVLYSSMTESDLDAVITCFNEVYPDINIEVVNGSQGELIARIQGEAENPVGDVTWGGMANSDGDKYKDIFEAWVTANDETTVPAYKSTNGLYSMDHLSTAVFCVNTELEAELGLEIKSYQDLLDPKLTGKIVSADPNSSSAAWNNLCNIMAVYGNDSDEAWAYMEALMPQLVIAGSSSACFKNVQDGEYVVGLTYEDGAVKLLQQGATNIRIVYPEEGASASAFGVAIIKGAPHQAAAKAFADFVTSAEGQTAMAEYMEGTLRFTNANYVVPENAWLPATDEITWADRDVEWLTANKDQILEHWNDSYATIVG